MAEDEGKDVERPAVHNVDGPPPVLIPPVQVVPEVPPDDTIERVVGFTMSRSGRENLWQGLGILGCMAVFAGVCALFGFFSPEDRGGAALIGALLGLPAGLIVTGTVAAVVRLFRRR